MLKKAEEFAGGPIFGGGKVIGPDQGDSPLRPRELGYLTATEDRLLILAFKHGMVHPIATSLRSEAPLSIVADIEIGKALFNPVTVRFTGGQVWFVVCDKANLGKVRALAERLLGPRPA
ncbi:hypothetical protein BH10ACT1_BH10ACT1_25180 [soil metagenome]